MKNEINKEYKLKSSLIKRKLKDIEKELNKDQIFKIP